MHIKTIKALTNILTGIPEPKEDTAEEPQRPKMRSSLVNLTEPQEIKKMNLIYTTKQGEMHQYHL